MHVWFPFTHNQIITPTTQRGAGHRGLPRARRGGRGKHRINLYMRTYIYIIKLLRGPGGMGSVGGPGRPHLPIR